MGGEEEGVAESKDVDNRKI